MRRRDLFLGSAAAIAASALPKAAASQVGSEVVADAIAPLVAAEAPWSYVKFGSKVLFTSTIDGSIRFYDPETIAQTAR